MDICPDIPAQRRPITTRSSGPLLPPPTTTIPLLTSVTIQIQIQAQIRAKIHKNAKTN